MRVVAAPPEPLRLARRLAGRPCVALLWDQRAGTAWLASDPERCVEAPDPDPSRDLGAPVEPPLAGAPAWIGVLPYEATRAALERAPRLDPAGGPDPRRTDTREAVPLMRPRWLRYGAVARIDRAVTVLGDDPRAVERLAAALEGTPDALPAAPLGARLVDDEPTRLHEERIRAALELIARGELYQVNLARRLVLALRGSSLEALGALAARAPAPFAAALDLEGVGVASTSPELFLDVDGGGRLATEPIKGTRPRDPDPGRDAALARDLDADPKERAELAMILDVERNDLGRVAETGSVRLTRAPHVVAHATVFHREARLEAQLRRGVSRAEVLAALLPSGSVTGAPKRRAMEIIRDLEPWRRGLYTGAFGFVSHDGGMRLGMAIRTLVMRDGHGWYHTGGGIVADSDPAREVEETRWKAAQVLGLLG